MRLLFVNYEYPPLGGGGGVACREVATALARRHEVHVLTSGAAGLPAEEVLDGVRVWRAPVIGRGRRAVASIVSMLSFYPAGLHLGSRLCRAYRYDLVSSWFVVPSGAVGAHLAARGGLPHVVHVMGSDVHGPTMWHAPPSNPVLSGYVGRLLRGAAACIAPSHDLARRARGLAGAALPIEVIPHGLPPPPFRCLRRPTSRDGPVDLVSIARLVPRKRTATLLAALAALHRQGDGPPWGLTLVGDGPERPRLEAQAKAAGIADRVTFAGYVDETMKHRLLAAADLFVLASEHEGFGLVYIEAMQHGLPVIASRDGGQEDFLQDGDTGRLVPPGDSAALAEAIEALALDPARRQAIGRHNRAIARNFTTTAAAERCEALFSDLTTPRQTPARPDAVSSAESRRRVV